MLRKLCCFGVQRKPDLEIRTNQGATALWRAAVDNNLPIVKILLQAGADVDAVFLATGETPLLAALASGNTVVVKELLNSGADIGARTPDGITALHQAARSGDVELVVVSIVLSRVYCHGCLWCVWAGFLSQANKWTVHCVEIGEQDSLPQVPCNYGPVGLHCGDKRQ